MKTRWNCVWLAVAITVTGCGGDDETAETAVNVEGAETVTEGEEESGETEAESAVLASCLDGCNKEFVECAGNAPEDFYENINLAMEWPLDLASCTSMCEEIIPVIASVGEECVDLFLEHEACTGALSCEEYFEYSAPQFYGEEGNLYCIEKADAYDQCVESEEPETPLGQTEIPAEDAESSQ